MSRARPGGTLFEFTIEGFPFAPRQGLRQDGIAQVRMQEFPLYTWNRPAPRSLQSLAGETCSN